MVDTGARPTPERGDLASERLDLDLRRRGQGVRSENGSPSAVRGTSSYHAPHATAGARAPRETLRLRARPRGHGDPGRCRYGGAVTSDAGGRGAKGGGPTAAVEHIDRRVIQLFALVGEAIAGATHALLAGDREAARELVARDEEVDRLYRELEEIVEEELVGKSPGTPAAPDASRPDPRYLLSVLGMLPELERSGDLAEHVARRATRNLGAEMSARARGLVEQMGEIASTMWRMAADAYADRQAQAALRIDELDDELDELHVNFTAEIVDARTSLPVAIELALVGRFYERFGDHAVNLARRVAREAAGDPPVGPTPDA